MLARGSLGNPWLFERLLGDRRDDPTPDEVLDELDWVIDCAAEHFGPERAARNLRKFYPWYLDRLDAPRAAYDALQHSAGLDDARTLLAGLRLAPAPA
jgi:tRNA-dihydrouridine synthase